MNVFIYHWKDGQCSVTRAITPKGGLQKLGYGDGAISALDFYAIGTLKYQYSENNWVARSELGRLKFDCNVDEFRSKLENAFAEHTSVIVELDDGDEVCLERLLGDYCNIGKVSCICLYLAVRHEGNYYDDDDCGYYFMCGSSTHFHLDQEQDAISAAMLYVQRRHTEQHPEFSKAASLESIAERLDQGFSW